MGAENWSILHKEGEVRVVESGAVSAMEQVRQVFGKNVAWSAVLFQAILEFRLTEPTCKPRFEIAQPALV